MNISEEVKRTYLAMLFKIGMADGSLNQWEEHYIFKIAGRLNISTGDLDSILKNPDQWFLS